MGFKDRLRRAEDDAKDDGVVIRQRDGSVKVFPPGEVWREVFLTRMSLLRDTPRDSEVMDAVRGATPHSRAEFEARWGRMTPGVGVLGREGWVEERRLTEDGTIEHRFHSEGTEEAERLRAQAKGSGPPREGQHW